MIHYMNRSKPSLLPLFRSKHQLTLLGHIFLNVGNPQSIAQIATATRIPQPTISREVERLRRSGVITTQAIGRNKLVEANTANPYFPELQSLLLKAVGPASVLVANLRKIDGIDQAFIFGSWARRYHGEAGLPPADVDVLVVGDPDPDLVDDACARAERKVKMDINPVILLPKDWDSPPSGFVKQLKRESLVPLFDETKHDLHR